MQRLQAGFRGPGRSGGGFRMSQLEISSETGTGTSPSRTSESGTSAQCFHTKESLSALLTQSCPVRSVWDTVLSSVHNAPLWPGLTDNG